MMRSIPSWLALAVPLASALGWPLVDPASVAEPRRSSPRAAAASCVNGVLSGRDGHTVTYDPVGHRVLLFGGTSNDSTDQWPRSLWAWDGRAWTCLGADGPPGRDSPEMAFDERRNQLVLYGGRTNENRQSLTVLTDTWVWDGARWTLADTVGPGRRMHAFLAYDRVRRAVLLHGGLRGGADPLARDTWEWDGSQWRPTDVAIGPAGEYQTALVATPDGVLLSMSIQDSVANCVSERRASRGRARAFQLRGSQWTPVGTAGPCVPGGGLYGVAWTPDGMLLYSGWSSDTPPRAQSWIMRAGSWQRIHSAPSPRRGARMIYDPDRRRVLLFGGFTERELLTDTWEWDGTRWTRRD